MCLAVEAEMPAKSMVATLVGRDSHQIEIEMELADGPPFTSVGGVRAGWVWDLITRPRA